VRPGALGVFLVLALALGAPAWASDTWILQVGPEATDGIPLDPPQPVPAWRGLYGDGQDRVWIYATSSPHFFAPALAEVRRAASTPWTLVAFFPDAWKADRRAAWLDRWIADFQVLATLPDPGWPILFPSVLRKN